MVCENGLVVSSREFENMKIRHYGYSFEELQDTIKAMVEKLPLTVESLNKFRQVELSQEQALDFAKKALEVRLGELSTVCSTTSTVLSLVKPVKSRTLNKTWLSTRDCMI
jgi:hypothetical protein